MKKKLLIAIAFISALNAYALNIGTTNIVFSYEDTNLTAEQKTIVSNNVHKLLAPVLPFSFLDDYGNNNLALALHKNPRTYDSPIFNLATCENNILTLPITKEFSTELLGKQSLQTTHTNAFNTIAAFCNQLKNQNVTQLTNAEVDEQILLSSSQMEEEEDSTQMKRAFLLRYVGATFYDVSLACYIKTTRGPGSNEHLWAMVPVVQNGEIVYLPLIYYNNNWRISFWGMF